MGDNSLPVGCFGKLPFWPEYLEVGVVLPCSRAMREWLHRGREAAGLAAGDDGSRDVEVQSTLRLLLGLPGSTELLAGVLRPSIDRGGRSFPFTVFVHFPRRMFGKHHALLPLALTPVWEELDDAWDSLAAMATRDAFREVLGSLRVRAPEPVRSVRQTYQRMLGESTQGLFARDGGPSIDELGSSMPDVLARLRRGGARGVCVDLPVSDDLADAGFDASFWIDLLNKQFFMRRFDPTVLLDATPDRTDRHAFFKFGALRPEDYSGTLGGGQDDGDVLRPANGGSRSAAGAPGETRPSYAEILRTRFRGGRE